MQNKTNDQRVLELKKQVEEKKELLKSTDKFTPITNCSIEIYGTRYNIQTLDRDKLTLFLVELNSYLLSAKDLGIVEEFNISGYNIIDWIKDVKSKLDISKNIEEKAKLKLLEAKLSQLLSNDKKVELEIDSIENLLKIN